MRAIIQRVLECNVEVSSRVVGTIEHGLLILLGIEVNDIEEDMIWLCRKISNMRIFSDDAQKMNLSIKDIDGEILIVSQFTLFASTVKGNRPSFIKAAKPDFALEVYKKFVKVIERSIGKKVKTGVFGADMKVSLINDGPVTIILDSKNRE